MEDDAGVKVVGTPLHPGRGGGPLLRLDEPLSLWGGTEPGGQITDPHHPQHGESLTGRVVVMHTGRGSSSSSSILAEMIRAGTGPSALILAEPDGILFLGALVAAELYGRRLPIVVVGAEELASLPASGEARVVCDIGSAVVTTVSP